MMNTAQWKGTITYFTLTQSKPEYNSLWLLENFYFDGVIQPNYIS